MASWTPWLLGPAPHEPFLSKHWDKRPFHRRGNAVELGSLLSLRDIEHMLVMATQSEPDAVELIRHDHEVLTPAARGSVQAIQSAYDGGDTIRIVSAHRFSKKLLDLCRELEAFFAFPVQANVYCSPPGSKAVGAHFDFHDVFIVQVAGTKVWRIGTKRHARPAEYLPSLGFEDRADGATKRDALFAQPRKPAPTQRLLLRSGDSLYLPRGWVHAARTGSEGPSIHVTVGVVSFTLLDCLLAGLRDVAGRDTAFLESLRPGFRGRGGARGDERKVRALLRKLVLKLDARRAMAALSESFFKVSAKTEPVRLARDASETRRIRVTSRTTVERRAGTVCRARPAGRFAYLEWADRTVRLPARAFEASAFVVDTPRFRVADLTGSLTPAEKVAIVQLLVEEQLLVVAPDV